MLQLLSHVWGAAAALRVRLYRRGWRSRHRLPRPAVSIGALGVGGTGLVGGSGPQELALEGPAHRDAARAAAEIRERYGDDAVMPARLAPHPDPGRKGGESS